MDNLSEKIIESVRGNVCIYDKRDSKFKDVKYKERVWEDISKEINLPVKEVKVKWKSLRDKYRRMKNTADLPSGSGLKIGAPWKYMASMEFLADSIEPASTIGNVSEELDTSVEWLQEDSNTSQLSRSSSSRKRPSDDLFVDVLTAIKKKYEEQPKEKYGYFFNMLRDKFDRLPQTTIDELEIEILQLTSSKINGLQK